MDIGPSLEKVKLVKLPSIILVDLDQLRKTRSYQVPVWRWPLRPTDPNWETGAKFRGGEHVAGAFSARGEELKINNSRMVDNNSLRWQVRELLHHWLGLSARRGQGDGWTSEEGHSPLGRPPGRGGVRHSGRGGQYSYKIIKFRKTFSKIKS